MGDTVTSSIGTKIPRQFVVSIWAYAFAGFALIAVVTAWLGVHDWGLPKFVGGIAVVLLVLPNLFQPRREFVQVDDAGVAVETKKGIERVSWSNVQRVRIRTTSAGPWVEDVFFLLDGPDGTGCAVPHSAAVRTQLLEELQSRLSGVRDDQVIEAMGCSTENSFTIWEKPQHGVAQQIAAAGGDA